MELKYTDIKKAYLYVKSYAYHDNLNLFLKQRVAEFEVENTELDFTFESIASLINENEADESELFTQWLSQIGCHVLPKSVKREEGENRPDNGLFISNVRDSERYTVSKVNYFINAPTELHIIEMLWCLFAGSALESGMSKDSYGNRMHSTPLLYAVKGDELCGQEVFKRYIDQYNLWRDQAINVATEVSKNGDDVALLSLDLKSFFYQIDLDFESVSESIRAHYQDNEALCTLALSLTSILEKIYETYQLTINEKLKLTHPGCVNKKGLPIGFASSSIIANWYLSEFDKAVGNDVRPVYYGRYVDDILMVFKRPKFDEADPIQSFVKHYLSIVLSPVGGDYVIEVGGNQLPMQKDKLILQFFDKRHSRAGLEVFKQELDERSSAFKFLPNEHIDKELDRFAYDVLYDGSANKFRSIVGLSENETELAKYLASHVTAHRLSKLDKKDIVLPQLKQFFKGQNALQFFRLWEKLYQYAIITQSYKFIKTFYEYLEAEILKIDGGEGSGGLLEDFRLYNQIALSITLGLLDIKERKRGFHLTPSNPAFKPSAFESNKRYLDELMSERSELHFFSWQFRHSNMIRHHLVSWPLANFSDYAGSLTCEAEFIRNMESIKLDDSKVGLSPRFIHFDEWQVFDLRKALGSKGGLSEWINDSLVQYKRSFYNHDIPVAINPEAQANAGVTKSLLSIGGESETKDDLNLAIANLVVNKSDIEKAVRKDRSPNVSFSRQQKLYSVLNVALKEKADVLVMPEVSVPVSWLPFMVSFSRRHQIGLIFGLEHWVVGDTAYNLIIEALPFKSSGKYKSCVITARIKNHYAPAEKEMLESIRLKPGNQNFQPNAFYHKVSWRGVSFATYNCFELSDITHRVLFKSEIDLLFACVWNRDTNYYQHILESVVRDLHCYTVQANTAQYGGSCILQPTETAKKTMLYVKGGNNPCVLTTKLNIKGLRAFQYKSKPDTIDDFKHLPPGYDSESVLNR